MTIEWLDEERFRVGDLVFRYTQDYTAVTTDKEVIILKERPFVEFYIALLERERPKHLLEVGFYEGGSALLWAMLFPDMRITAIDFRPVNPTVERLATRFPNLELRYGVSQDDAEALASIAAPNMIIDDASHDYATTRRTFELLFPRLARGEKYVIEDWGWGHWPNWGDKWADMPLLSNLIIELTIATASSSEWIERLEADFRTAIVTRGKMKGPLSLDALWNVRGRSPSLEPAPMIEASAPPPSFKARLAAVFLPPKT